jgi:hypothetical protein
MRAIAVLLAAIVPLLAGCAATGMSALAPEGESEAGVLRLDRAPEGFSIDQPPADAAHVLMGAQSTVSVALIYRGDELQPETTAHALSGEMLPSRDEAVAADDGEQFVAVKFAKESRTTTLVDDTPSAQAQAQAQRIVITRDGESQRYPIANLTGDEFYLFQAPVDASPDDAVLEVEIEGVTQRLSLLTGERLPSELDALFDRHGEVSYDSEGQGYVSEYVEVGDREHNVLTWIQSVSTEPLMHGHGWPDEGEMFLWADVQLRHTVNNDASGGGVWRYLELEPGSGTTITVELADGSVREALLVQELASGSDTTYRVWFSVPADLDAAQVVVDVHPFDTGDDVRGALEQPRVTVDLEFSASGVGE